MPWKVRHQNGQSQPWQGPVRWLVGASAQNDQGRCASLGLRRQEESMDVDKQLLVEKLAEYAERNRFTLGEFEQ